MPSHRATPTGIVLLAVLWPVAARADTLTDAMRKEDPRLEQRVSLATSRIPVGALLEKLSAQTGVRITADDRQGAGDDEVAVFLHDVPLATAMDALWSLL